MKRLTMCIDTRVYYSQNGNPILPVEMLETPLVREVLRKLSEYEDIGTVKEFEGLKETEGKKLLSLINWLKGEKYLVDEKSETMTEEFETKYKWELSRNCMINKTIDKIKELL